MLWAECKASQAKRSKTLRRNRLSSVPPAPPAFRGAAAGPASSHRCRPRLLHVVSVTGASEVHSEGLALLKRGDGGLGAGGGQAGGRSACCRGGGAPQVRRSPCAGGGAGAGSSWALCHAYSALQTLASAGGGAAGRCRTPRGLPAAAAQRRLPPTLLLSLCSHWPAAAAGIRRSGASAARAGSVSASAAGARAATARSAARAASGAAGGSGRGGDLES